MTDNHNGVVTNLDTLQYEVTGNQHPASWAAPPKKIAEGLTLYWETESQASKRKGMGNEAGKGVQMLRKMAWPHLLTDTFVKVACP